MKAHHHSSTTHAHRTSTLTGDRAGSRRSAQAQAFGFRPSATLHRSARPPLPRRRRLRAGAILGGTVVAASSGLAAVLASGAYAAPHASGLPTVSSATYLGDAAAHQQQQARQTTVEVAADRRLAALRAAKIRAARQRVAASRAAQRTALSADSFRGLASWYGPGFQGRPTASGQPFDENALTAASRTLPLGTHLRVCNGAACVTVLINDWGPAPTSRVLDLSRAAAEAIGIYAEGVGEVTATVVS